MILLMVAPRGAATLLFMKEIKMSRNVNAINEDANRIADMIARNILDLPPRNAGEKPITVKHFTNFTERVNVQSCSPFVQIVTEDWIPVLRLVEDVFDILFVKYFMEITSNYEETFGCSPHNPSFVAQHNIQVMDFTKIDRGTLQYRISVYYEDRQYFIVDVRDYGMEIFFDTIEDKQDFINAFKDEDFHEHTEIVR